MIFVDGKYHFMNKRNKFNNGQQKYYEKHKDSLDKVKGNDLLPLPEL